MQVTEEIKNRLNIVEVVQSYVRLDKAGNYWKAPCPFHQERTPSFVVNEERNMWHCFGCNKGGDAFAFIMEIENLSFREALEILADRAGVEIPRYHQEQYSQEKSLKEKLGSILELATKFYEKQLWEGEGKRQALPYLQKRGLTDESIRTFRLGYAPKGWSHLTEFLTKKGYTAKELEAAGLVIAKKNLQPTTYNLQSGTYDRFRDRIMFPIENTFGKVIGYSARVTPGSDESTGKYINTPETPLYHKSDVLYGIAHAKASIKEKNESILVEGNMDVIALHQAGFSQTVAVSGTALTQEQLRILKRYTDTVKLFFDMDEAGQKAARKSLELALQNEFQVSMVTLPSGKDAADLAVEDRALLAKSVEEAQEGVGVILEKFLAANDTTTAVGKQKVTKEFAALMSHIQSHVMREHWIHTLGQKLGVSETSLREDIQRLLKTTPETEVPTSAPEAPTNRAEKLREEYVALLLSLPGVWKEEVEKRSDVFKEYVALHPLHFYIVQAGDADALSLIQEPDLQQLATRLIFHLAQAEEAKGITDIHRTESRKKELEAIVEALEDEVGAKPRLQELQTLLEKARKKGDRAEEQKLLEEFTRLSVRLASKSQGSS